MSSFKTNKIARYCVHCKLPSSTSLSPNIRCSKCKLWDFKVKGVKDPSINIKNIYVINLEKDKQRLNSFFNLIKKQKISTKKRGWFRFNAVDGSNFDSLFEKIKNYENNKKIFELWKKHPGSIGCYLSHIKLWETILKDEKSSEYTLIMEDDSYFTLNGLANIEIVLGTAKNLSWDLLYIGHNKLKGQQIHPLFLRPSITRPGENNRGFNSGLYGYIVRKSSLQKLLNIVKRFDSSFIDVQLRNSFQDFSALFVTSELIKHFDGKSRRTTIDRYKPS